MERLLPLLDLHINRCPPLLLRIYIDGRLAFRLNLRIVAVLFELEIESPPPIDLDVDFW